MSKMPLDTEKLPFTIPEDQQPREKILKLGRKITDRVPAKVKGVKATDPEYWGLAGMVTDEMADVALKMKVRHGYTFEQMLKLTGLPAQELHKLLDEMSIIGLLEYNWEDLEPKNPNPNHEKRWFLPRFVPGSAEFFNMNPDNLDRHPEVAAFFERMTFMPLEKITPMVPPGGAGIGMHVIPVEKAIDAESESIGIEHISYWLDKYDGKYAASPCSCRLSRARMGEGCADDPEDWCIAIGDMADYVVETQKGGRYITREEALEIFEYAEKLGRVHQITNIDGEDKIFAICNCNLEVCNALRTSQLFNTPNMSASAYTASVKPENCVACGMCVEVCPAGAVKLGQKLCTNQGPIEYPRHPLPDDTPWGPDMWDIDYRDNNQKNCYDTGTAPCKTACPAHIAVQGYLKMAAQGRFTEALALIKKNNPFPAVCGRICNRRCEDECTRGTVDEAVAIDEVKKFIAELDLDAETRYIPPKMVPKVQHEEGFDEKIAIIGAGPAGLSCAYYLAELGYSPVVFEKNEKPGGMLTYGIPSYKLSRDVVEAEIDVLRALGVEIKCGVEVGKDVTLDELRQQGFKAFYVAIGCQGGRAAGVPGEDAEGVVTAVEFLHGVSGGQPADVPEHVVVIGGGNVAVDAASCAKLSGAKEVEMFCLESREEMPASDEEVAELLGRGAQLNCGWGPKEVLVEGGKVRGIVLKRCTRVFNDEGRFAPEYDENDTIAVECGMVIMAIGQSIAWGGLLDGSAVEFGRGNGPVADPLTYQTAENDIFVGGDVYTGPSFAINAIAAGHEGAISLHRYVRPNASLTIGRNRRDFIELDKDNLVFSADCYDKPGRQKPAVNTNLENTFYEAKCTLSPEQVQAETSRCLSCGASVVDPNKCIGCGLCTVQCSFDAIHLHREHPERSKMVKCEDKLKYILPNIVKRQKAIRKKKRAIKQAGK